MLQFIEVILFCFPCLMVLFFSFKLNYNDTKNFIFPESLRKLAFFTQITFALIFFSIVFLQLYYNEGNTIFTLTRDQLKEFTQHKLLYFISIIFTMQIVKFKDIYPRKTI